MSTPSSLVAAAKNKFISAEPAIAAHAAAAVVAYVLTLLVTHGVITSDRASVITQQVLPPVVSLFLVLLGWLVRRVVVPLASYAQRVEDEVQRRIAELALSQPPAIDASVEATPQTPDQPAAGVQPDTAPALTDGTAA